MNVSQKHTHTDWVRLCSLYPEVRPLGVNFKFPGRGQHNTPVVDARGLVGILMLLPGRKAAQFREKAADTLVRYLGGDKTLVGEIRAIRAQAESDPTSTAAVFRAHAQVDAEPVHEHVPVSPQVPESLAIRAREVKIQERELAIHERKFELRQKELSFLVELHQSLPVFWLDKDPRFKSRIADQVHNLARSGSTQPNTLAIEGRSNGAQFMTVAAYMKKKYNTQQDVDTRISANVGRRAAHIFRETRKRPNPNKTIKYVNGESRDVAVYAHEDFEVLEEAIASAVACGVYDPQTLKLTI